MDHLSVAYCYAASDISCFGRFAVGTRYTNGSQIMDAYEREENGPPLTATLAPNSMYVDLAYPGMATGAAASRTANAAKTQEESRKKNVKIFGSRFVTGAGRMPKAILTVLAVMFSLRAAGAHDFNAESAFLAYVKLTRPENIQPYVEIFSKRFSPNLPQPRNKFVKSLSTSDATSILTKEVNAFDLNEPFMISTEAEFGTYDFGRKQFEFRPISPAAFFSSDPGWQWQTVSNIDLIFDNANRFQELSMAPDVAEKFLAQHSARRVYLEIMSPNSCH